MDVKTAFLYRDIDTKVYVELLTRHPSNDGDIVCKLNKALYRLK